MLPDVDGVLSDATGPIFRPDAGQRRPPLAHDYLPQRQGGRTAEELLLREHRRRRHLRRVAVLAHPAAPAAAGKSWSHILKYGHNW